MISNSVRERLLSFFYKYPDIFTDYEKDYILDYSDLVFEDGYCPELVREVFDELGLIPDNINIYDGFFNLLNETFIIKNKNIIEVGGGVLPRLGERITTKIGNGRITIYDPRLSKYLSDSSKMILKREMFSTKTDVSSCDLIIGLMPCKGAEELIKSATSNNIDFMLALCEGGEHGDYFDYYEDEEEWISTMLTEAKENVENNNMGKLKVKDLKKYNDPYPIIYNER